ncbi:MAG: metallophosphoesterase [Planctomycetota bacterium]|nr:metallophosphoesterase [Planctomycetota bacterium]
MKLFVSVLGAFVSLDLWVWVRLDRLLRPLGARLWRAALAFLILCAIGFAIISMFANHFIGREHQIIPQWIPASIYIWHFLILPVTFLALLIHKMVGSVDRQIRKYRSRRGLELKSTEPETQATPPPQLPLVHRRQFLAAAISIPPVATFSLATIATSQIGIFRINRHDIAVRGLPQELDNFTIALVADVHTGVFSTPKMLRDIVARTNDLRAELILMGGDLINISHADLPSALDMANRLDSPNGMYMVQGNHDVVMGPGPFNAICRAAGVNLLVNEIATLRPRGIPLQILGMKWGDSDEGRHADIAHIVAQRDPGAFPIVLAHHPHTWDPAAAHGLPLVIAGHTHGGQIMLTDNIGGGPLRFKYWSGLYRRKDSTLLVSNGVGNWFPLRVNAPAEINHITLHVAKS